MSLDEPTPATAPEPTPTGKARTHAPAARTLEAVKQLWPQLRPKSKNDATCAVKVAQALADQKLTQRPVKPATVLFYAGRLKLRGRAAHGTFSRLKHPVRKRRGPARRGPTPPPMVITPMGAVLDVQPVNDQLVAVQEILTLLAKLTPAARAFLVSLLVEA